MENQNTRLINPRENPSFNEIHTQETIFGKQSQFTVYNPILRRTSPQKRRSDITLRFLFLITSLQTLIFEQRLHPSTNSPSNRSPRHNGGRIYLSLGLSGIRKIRLAIKSSFPATGRGRLLQVRLGKRKRDKRMFRLPNVTTWMMDDTLIVGIYAPRLFRPTIFG